MTKITIKPFVNKRTKQLSITIPKRKIKASNPTIRFDEDLFVRFEIFNKKRSDKK